MLNNIRKPVLLFAEDEEAVRTITESMLKMFGFEVITAVDGQDAIEKYESKKDQIDIVVLDMSMPRLSGRETFKYLHDKFPDLKIVIATGEVQEEVQDVLDAGAKGVILKPFSIKDILGELNQVLAE